MATFASVIPLALEFVDLESALNLRLAAKDLSFKEYPYLGKIQFTPAKLEKMMKNNFPFLTENLACTKINLRIAAHELKKFDTRVKVEKLTVFHDDEFENGDIEIKDFTGEVILISLIDLADPKFQGISYLEVTDCDVINVKSLRCATDLIFKKCYIDVPLSEFCELKYLENLSLADCVIQSGGKYVRIQDISGLKGGKFKSLDLLTSCVKDITPLAQCTNLRNLNLAYSDVIDIGALSNLTNLRELDISYTMVYDLKPLKHIKLEKLIAVETSITNLEYVKGVRELDIGTCTDVEKIPTLKNIVKLDMNGMEYIKNYNLDFLAKAKNLERLIMVSTPISDVSALKNCKKLRYLDMSATLVKEVPALSSLYCLTAEDMGSPVKLGELKNLEILNVNNTTIGKLPNMPKICYIYAEDTTFENKKDKNYVNKINKKSKPVRHAKKYI